MQRVFRFLLILAFAAASHAGLAGDRGTYDFLRLDVGARAGALNGSFVSMTNDPNLLFYNPAALPTLELDFSRRYEPFPLNSIQLLLKNVSAWVAGSWIPSLVKTISKLLSP